MLDTLIGLWNLRWTQRPPRLRPLPAAVNRDFIQTPGGPIELLSCVPRTHGTSPPLLFVHGGSGSAGVWLEWMTWLAERQSSPSYSLSVRGHGASYSVPYFRMVWQFTFEELATDLLAAVEEVRSREGTFPILVCHSAGATTAQYLLSKGLIKTPALVLAGAVPHYGIFKAVYQWFIRLDWGVHMRTLAHLFHPRSPLSTTTLVHNAFFSSAMPRAEVAEFEQWMADYESMRWPMAVMGTGPGVEGKTWLNPDDIVGNITGWDHGNDRILVILGTEDKIIQGTQGRVITELAGAIKKSRSLMEHQRDERQASIRLVEIPETSHHLQNDLKREEGAKAVLEFLLQL